MLPSGRPRAGRSPRGIFPPSRQRTRDSRAIRHCTANLAERCVVRTKHTESLLLLCPVRVVFVYLLSIEEVSDPSRDPQENRMAISR